MRPALIVLSIVVLVANVAPSLMFLAGRIDLDTCKSWMLWATIAWYIVGGALIYGAKPPKLQEPVVP
jgi:predicted membrane channel-forming protein YqfA (hemolysin III family)